MLTQRTEETRVRERLHDANLRSIPTITSEQNQKSVHEHVANAFHILISLYVHHQPRAHQPLLHPPSFLDSPQTGTGGSSRLIGTGRKTLTNVLCLSVGCFFFFMSSACHPWDQFREG